MRLLNCYTFQFAEFYGNDVPPYLILSHRWGTEEVSYKDFSKGRGQTLSGYVKIMEFCEFAREHCSSCRAETDHIKWVWVDTCCIDKRSSAELSEAINSMWTWYQRAEACIVYMTDVENGAQIISAFEKSVWFTRGWCLQELLAPRCVMFCTSTWTIIGYKGSRIDLRMDEISYSQHYLSDRITTAKSYPVKTRVLNYRISAITGIQLRYLLQPSAVFEASVARRLSWAARRTTTRKEDEAYCLLGLCDINMPLLYGEGPRAFRRLQEAIVARSDDQSLFAWNFEYDIVRRDTSETLPYAITNIGRLQMRCKPERLQSVAHEGHDAFVIQLNCSAHIKDRLVAVTNGRPQTVPEITLTPVEGPETILEFFEGAGSETLPRVGYTSLPVEIVVTGPESRGLIKMQRMFADLKPQDLRDRIDSHSRTEQEERTFYIAM